MRRGISIKKNDSWNCFSCEEEGDHFLIQTKDRDGWIVLCPQCARKLTEKLQEVLKEGE